MRPNHYATLGVEPGASAADIRAAYLGLIREYHPDRNPSPEAGERARSVIAAFKVLSDFDQRNRYDWDRRRERERVVALTAVPDRTLDKKAAVVGAGGAALVAAAMIAWSIIMPTPNPTIAATRVGHPPSPTELREQAGDPPSRPDDAAPARVRNADHTETIIRMRPELSQRPKRAIAAEEEQRTPAKPVMVHRKAQNPVVKLAERKQVDWDAKPIAKPVAARIAPDRRPPATTDLAQLDQFVMAFYGQSWRYGDARKRSALEQSRSAFVVRRASCGAEACKRAAYLKLQRDVSSIVESGSPAR